MKRLSTIFISAICALWLGGCINDDVPGRREVVRVGDSLPDFSVTMNDGSVVTGDSLRKSVAVVLFFHTTCPDCQQLLPQIQPLYDEYSPRGVAFALIGREESAASVAAFWREHNLTMPYSPQEDRAVYSLFAKSLIPRVYISDDEGRVRYIFTDDPVPSYSEIESALEAIL